MSVSAGGESGVAPASFLHRSSTKLISGSSGANELSLAEASASVFVISNSHPQMKPAVHKDNSQLFPDHLNIDLMWNLKWKLSICVFGALFVTYHLI